MVERTVPQALGILARRQEGIKAEIIEQKKEIGKLREMSHVSNEIFKAQEGEDIVEIRERYDDEEEDENSSKMMIEDTQPAETTTTTAQAAKQRPDKQPEKTPDNFDDFWARLKELEELEAKEEAEQQARANSAGAAENRDCRVDT